jgi:hypothetical protein
MPVLRYIAAHLRYYPLPCFRDRAARSRYLQRISLRCMPGARRTRPSQSLARSLPHTRSGHERRYEVFGSDTLRRCVFAGFLKAVCLQPSRVSAGETVTEETLFWPQLCHHGRNGVVVERLRDGDIVLTDCLGVDLRTSLDGGYVDCRVARMNVP